MFSPSAIRKSIIASKGVTPNFSEISIRLFPINSGYFIE